MIWDKRKECMSRDELLDLQGKKLVAQVKYVYQNIAYYKKKMQDIGLEPEDIRGIEDLDKLPYTTNRDILYKDAENLANSPVELEQIHILGNSKDTRQTENCTANDRKLRAECMARFLSMAGFHQEDAIQMTYNGDMAAGRQGIKNSIEKMGIRIIDGSRILNASNSVSMMAECGATGILCTPTYLDDIARALQESKYAKTFGLKSSICSGELLSEASRRYMEDIFQGNIYSSYGLKGASGFGVACECEYQNGMHIQEDLFLAELYHETGTETLHGEGQGELVLTTLEKGRYPLIRYRTEDIVSLNRETCGCGRTTTRMTQIKSRNKIYIMIRGKYVLRFRIEDALTGLDNTETAYTVYIDKEHNLDVVSVIIEFCRQGKADQVQGEEIIKNKVRDVIEEITEIKPRVFIVNREIINRFESGKVTILDQRSLDQRSLA